jgi:hypothetical protein
MISYQCRGNAIERHEVGDGWSATDLLPCTPCDQCRHGHEAAFRAAAVQQRVRLADQAEIKGNNILD